MAVLAHAYQDEWRQAEVWGDAADHDPRMAGPIIDRLRREALSREFPEPKTVLRPVLVRLLRAR
jgi:hypothetical protein